MNLTPFFKEYMKNYEGLDDYLVEIDGQSMYEWNYEDGCLFVGASRLYKLTGDREYLDFIVKMVSPYIEEDGTIKSYHREEYNLDFINAGKIFYFLYDETGEERYRKACDTLMTQLTYQPRLTTGNFWHKLIYPFQVWLDGLYMGQPFYMEYENRFNERKNYSDIMNQFNQARTLLYDEKTGLYYHAYDEYKDRKWADPETGLSPNFWLRSIGWYLMALVDCYELASEEIYEVKARFGEQTVLPASCTAGSGGELPGNIRVAHGGLRSFKGLPSGRSSGRKICRKRKRNLRCRAGTEHIPGRRRSLPFIRNVCSGRSGTPYRTGWKHRLLLIGAGS